VKTKKRDTGAVTRFQPGSTGVCEAQLWKFSEPQDRYNREKEPDRVLVAAGSLDQALQYMRRRHGDFNINKAESLGMIALLSGSPLD
jgi:hypothetical protein